MSNEWSATSPGTFGELVQGKIGETNFLITLPISRFSKATLKNHKDHGANEKLFDKSEKFVRSLGRLLGKELDTGFKIESELPRGKGLASSSADLTALGTALLSSLKLNSRFHPELIARAAAAVEPTDGVMYSGFVAYAQHEGRLIERYGALDFDIAGVLLEDEIDTVEYCSKNVPYTSAEKQKFETAMSWVRQGVLEKNLKKLGAASSFSADVNQKHLPKRNFEKLKALVRRFESPGLIVAHSGTAVGIILDPSQSEEKKQVLLTEMQNLFGLPAEIYRTWMNGPQLEPQVQASSAEDNESRIFIRGRNPRPRAQLTPLFNNGLMLFDQNGFFSGLSIPAHSPVDQLARSAAVVREVFCSVEIEMNYA